MFARAGAAAILHHQQRITLTHRTVGNVPDRMVDRRQLVWPLVDFGEKLIVPALGHVRGLRIRRTNSSASVPDPPLPWMTAPLHNARGRGRRRDGRWRGSG